LIQPTMMALPAVGTTILSPHTLDCLQLIEGDKREVSFYTSFQPHPMITNHYAVVLLAA